MSENGRKGNVQIYRGTVKVCSSMTTRKAQGSVVRLESLELEFVCLFLSAGLDSMNETCL